MLIKMFRRSRQRVTTITYRLSLITAVMLACAGCGTRTIYPLVEQGNYLTYDHPFTEAAAKAVLQNAGKICADRKQDAIRTNSVCSLTQCTTHYQCVLIGGGTGYEK